MSIVTIVLLVAGLCLLVLGAEWLVGGASRLAAAVGIPPLIVGLTVVAFGTSAPELAVSLQAALAGQADIALGNVVGSNILNILLILGVSALIIPLAVAVQVRRLDVPIMIGASLLALLLAWDGQVGQLDGALLVAGLLIYVGFQVWQGRREAGAATGPPAAPLTRAELGLNLLRLIAGFGLLVLGSRWLVDGAVTIARAFGLSELVIGLTIIAVGTSLPEIATSIIAALRGQRDIAVGNVVGSNIFNLLGILGVTSLVAPGGVAVAQGALAFDIPVMIAVAVACLPIFFTGSSIARWEGGLFLGYYVAYTAYVVLAAQQHDALPLFSSVMSLFVIPLTAITLLVVVGHGLLGNRRGRTAKV